MAHTSRTPAPLRTRNPRPYIRPTPGALRLDAKD